MVKKKRAKTCLSMNNFQGSKWWFLVGIRWRQWIFYVDNKFRPKLSPAATTELWTSSMMTRLIKDVNSNCSSQPRAITHAVRTLEWCNHGLAEWSTAILTYSIKHCLGFRCGKALKNTSVSNFPRCCMHKLKHSACNMFICSCNNLQKQNISNSWPWYLTKHSMILELRNQWHCFSGWTYAML